MALLQNFSVSRNNDDALTVTVEEDMTSDTLAGATVEWVVYGMSFGVPLPSPVLIAKTSADGGITILTSPPMTFVINLASADTINLELGNYYQEAEIVDNLSNRSTIMYGAIAVTLTMG